MRLRLVQLDKKLIRRGRNLWPSPYCWNWWTTLWISGSCILSKTSKFRDLKKSERMSGYRPKIGLVVLCIWDLEWQFIWPNWPIGVLAEVGWRQIFPHLMERVHLYVMYFGPYCLSFWQYTSFLKRFWYVLFISSHSTYLQFLDGSTHPWKRVCRSVRLAFFLNRGNHVEMT